MSVLAQSMMQVQAEQLEGFGTSSRTFCRAAGHLIVMLILTLVLKNKMNVRMCI